MSHDHDTVRTSCLPSPDIAGGTHAPGGPCVRRHHALLRQSQRNLPNRPRRRAHARPRLAAHVCGITGSRRDELALRRQWHLGSSRDRGGRRQCHVGIAAGAASGMSRSRRRQWHVEIAAPPVSCRDRGGRRQCHVGIAAGAASGMSRSRRAPPVACRDRGGRRQWHVGIAAGLRCVVHASCERRGGSRGCVPCGPRVRSVAIAAGRARAVLPARRVGRSRPHSPAGPALC
jgi:hypothetical protein